MYTMEKPNSTSLYPKMEDLTDLGVNPRPELVKNIMRQDVPGQRNERNDNHLGAPELEEDVNLAVSHRVVGDDAAVGGVVDEDQYLSRREGAYKRRETGACKRRETDPDFRQDGLDNCVNWKPDKKKDRAVGLAEESEQKEIRENIEDLERCLMPVGVTEWIKTSFFNVLSFLNIVTAPELEEDEKLTVSHRVVDDADGAAVGAVGVDYDQYLSRTEGEYNIGETDFGQAGLDSCVNWKKDRAVRLTEERREKKIRKKIQDLKCCLMPEGVTEEISNKLSYGLEEWYRYIVKLQGKDLEIAERFGQLCQLEEWTSTDVLRKFCKILNKHTPDCTTALGKDDLKDLLKKKETRYINLILMLGWVGNKLIITDRTNFDEGRHFVFVNLDTKKKQVYYCDSQGLKTPEVLHEYLIDLIDFTNKTDAPHVCIGSCHNYPFQECYNVCGLVVMYCSALAALERDLFLRLFVENKDETFLHDPTCNEGFLRSVLCTWIATDEIDLSLLKIEGVTESVPE